MRHCLYGFFVFFGFACNSSIQTKPASLFSLLDSNSTRIGFSNTLRSTDRFNIFNYRNFYNGGGVALGDINNDGLDDLFFTANMGQNKLYLNKGDWVFEDISTAAGFLPKADWSTGVVMVDINNDGWLDIYVCNAGYINNTPPQNRLFINNKNNTFSDSTEAYGLSNYGGYSTHAAFFDYDHDGDLDCYILNNSFIPVNTLDYANTRSLKAKDWPVADFLKGGGAKLLRNNQGKFVDVTDSAGIYQSLIGFGLGVNISDVNQDGWPDIYVSNDFFERDYLYINQKNGRFKEEYEERIDHGSTASMGADVGDINRDGFNELFTTEMLPISPYRLRANTTFDNYDNFEVKLKNGFHYQYLQNSLQLNDGTGHFAEIAHYAGVQASDWSWGALLFDFDNDGWNDIYVSNGIYKDVTNQDFINYFADEIYQKMAIAGTQTQIETIVSKMPSVPIPNNAFLNQKNLQFKSVEKTIGFETPSFSNGAAYADLDNDGDLDLVVNNVNMPAFVYRNNGRVQNKNHFLQIVLSQPSPNPFCVGASLKLYSGHNVDIREIQPSRGFQSSMPYRQHFGLGNITQIDSLSILWPNQRQTVLYHVPVDTLLFIHYEQTATRKAVLAPSTQPRPLLKPMAAPFIKTTEDDNVDFYEEKLVPIKQSTQGPKMAVGDVDRNGYPDVYIGGTAKEVGNLYLQYRDGFKKQPNDFLKPYTGMEDGPSAFFDANGDGLLDLLISAAGNNIESKENRLFYRLYIGDGKGHFALKLFSFPVNNMNIGALAVQDVNGDGAMDLFAGSYCITHDYGSNPTSYLYLNDGHGQFKDVLKNTALAQIGNVTAAAWGHLLQGNQRQLVVAGEYMGVTCWTYSVQKGIEQVHTNLDTLHGWWQAMAVADLNGDGLDDIVLGNIGNNANLKPSFENPITLYIQDFDGNGRLDKILTQRIDGNDIPVFMKRELEEQIPSLKKKNLLFKDFAKSNMNTLFDHTLLASAQKKLFNYAPSIIAINQGNGQFTIIEMPAHAQFSSINALCVADVNKDGQPDILFGGNLYGWLPQFGRLDASRGGLLINKGHNQFELPPAKETGLNVVGEVRSIACLNKEQSIFLFGINNQIPILFKLN